MALYAIICTRGHATLGAVIESAFSPDDVFKLKSDTWFVDTDKTSRALAEDLGIMDGRNGSGVVLTVNNWNGRAQIDLWEWLQQHTDA